MSASAGGARIAKLPPWLRPLAVRVRRALPEGLVDRLPPSYAYKSDGMATVHHSPFLHDEGFNAAYRAVADRWGAARVDLRWRIWMLTRCAEQCRSLPGAYAEFGVYRGASAFMILSRAAPGDGRVLHLFDTFRGIPSTHLTRAEHEAGFPGRLSDTSAEEVAGLLRPWRHQVNLVAGDLHETIPGVDTGALSFVHLDLNAASATRAALDYAYPRLVPGGMMVFDDYGWRGYEDQRSVIDTAFADKPETIIALPTGQAIACKL